MTIAEAKLLLEKEYDCYYLNSRCLQINFLDVLIDSYNYGFVDVLEEDGKLILTDFANHMQVFQGMEEGEAKMVCAQYGVEVNDYNIETPFLDLGDVLRYKECLIALAEFYSRQYGVV